MYESNSSKIITTTIFAFAFVTLRRIFGPKKEDKKYLLIC